MWKDAQYRISLGNCKWKEQGTTTYLLDWLKSTHKKAPNAGQDVDQQGHSLLVGMLNDISTSEDSLTVSTKPNIILQFDPTIIFLHICPNMLKAYTHTDRETLYINVYRSFAHNCPKLEATKMSFNRRIGKTSIDLYNGELFSDKNKLAFKPQKDMNKT